MFFSNAGLSRKGQETASDADWDVSWRVHVMSHVFAIHRGHYPDDAAALERDLRATRN